MHSSFIWGEMKVTAQRTLLVIVVVNICVLISRNDRFTSTNGASYYQLRDNLHQFSLNDGSSILKILASMFHHVDTAHLLSNMVGLLNYGTNVFVETTSAVWQSPMTILLVYLGSGIGARYGLLGLATLLEYQWKDRIRRNRRSARFTCNRYWLCRTLGFADMSQSWVDLYTHLFHADEYSALSLYKVVPRLGASGAVFGVLGARFYTSLFSRRTHSPLSQTEILYLVAILAYEASLTPIQLQNLWDLFVMGDNIDHAGHLLGFFTGFLLAFIIQRWQVYKEKRRYNWGAVGGRRLGTR
jgi:membrane associated rhomboid family serine protease